jgi:hypothetical protein
MGTSIITISRRLTAIASATPLLRLHARIRGGRVDEDDDRPRELLRHLHDAQRLAIPLGARVAEVAENLLLGVAPLLVPDERDRLSFVVPQAGHDRGVVREPAIAVQLDHGGKEPFDVIERVGPVGVPCHEHALPRRQTLEDLHPDLVGAPAQRVDGPLARRRLRQHAERLDLLQQDADGFFEFEQFRHIWALGFGLWALGWL